MSNNNVPTSTPGVYTHQQMVTFTLGMGARGNMVYSPTYQTDTSGDYYAIVNGSPASGSVACAASPATCICNWQATAGSICNWSVPSTAGGQNNIDDLWHAAVNGRGQYFSATDPATLKSGLAGALAGIHAIVGAASAAAVSSPNITQTSNSIFSSSYTTDYWDGNVAMQTIDPITGAVSSTINWCSDGSVAIGCPTFTGQTNPNLGMLDVMAQTDCATNTLESDPPTCTTPDISVSRTIYTFDSANTYNTNLKPFLYGNLTATEKGYFNSQCSASLSQCIATILTTTQIATADTGLYLVDYLRGSQWFESPVAIYRARQHIEGDSVNAEPAYVAAPTFSFIDTTVYSTGVALSQSYAQFLAAKTARQATLYVAANDGMLHAFNAGTGVEMWAYVPKIVMPGLHALADVNYPTQHQYFVDGTPTTMDIYVDTAANNLTVGWHTILVGGLGLGGRGFYALDVTNPASPKALWEICADSTVCAISDSDMGYSSGNPVITKRSSDGKWVVLVTSGYNNGTYQSDGVTANAIPGSGNGVLYELNAVTGAKLHKTFTGSGSAAAPSGLAKISPWLDSPQTNMTTRFIYGGDLNGNVWRFDLGPACTPTPCVLDYAPTVTQIATLKDGSGVAQPVTTRPQLGDPLGNVSNSLAVPVTGNPAVFVATGQYLGVADLTNYQVQSMYALKDNLAAAINYGNPRTYVGVPAAPFVQQYIYSPTSTTRTTSQNAVNWTTNSGWYANFQVVVNPTNVAVTPSPSPGERVNIDPQLVNGTLIVVTNVPNTNACTSGGSSWLYSFNFLTGTNVSTSPNGVVAVQLGGGSSMSAGFTIISTQGGKIYVENKGTDNTTTTNSPPITAGSTKRTSWRELTQ